MGSSNPARGASAKAQRSPAMQVMARVGYAMSGVLHLMLGWIVIQMGLPGAGDDGEASQTGAMAEIASQPFGKALLWAIAVGLVCLALWQAANVVTEAEWKGKAKAAGRGVVYLVLGALALRFALGMGSGGTDEQSVTADVMSYPLGRVAIGAVGLAIAAVGVASMISGITKKFAQNLRRPGKELSAVIITIGRIGHLAKGLALGVLGALFVTAAITADPEEAGGLDQAFGAIGSQPFGAVLLIVAGAGIACFGLYCFAQARYESI